MKAVQLDAVGEPLVTREVPVPKPSRGQVLVRMTASPVNPSDLAFLIGGYGFKNGLPVTPGNEGSGVVVATGGGLMATRLKGKKVSCFAPRGQGGAWAEYLLTDATYCVPVGDSIDLQQASMALINPLTALAFINIVKRDKAPAFLNTAAASALGQMLVRLAKREGLTLINVVRKDSQAEVLRAMGADHVLISSEKGFAQKLGKLTQQLNATLFFDAVGGSLLGKILLAAPHGTTILSYGRLANELSLIEPGALILQKKSIIGFFLSDWMEKRTLIQLLGDIRKMKSLLTSDVYTPIKHRVPLEKANEAIENYKAEMTGGKTLLVPSLEQEHPPITP